MPSRLLSLLILVALAQHCSADLWITGYYPGYKQNTMPPTEIDFSVVTHVIHFSLVPNSDGTFGSSANGVTAATASNIISRAHAAKRKALICVGGAGSQTGFQGATSNANLPVFVNNLVSYVSTNGYDGIDIDWEPLPASDFQQYTNLVIALRTALNGLTSEKMLTVAAAAYPDYPDSTPAEYRMYASVQDQLDQINVMTYDLSGPYAGWVTWFNSPIYNGGATFPSSSRELPCIDSAITRFITNGVAPSKLGLGTPFYGDVWKGGSGASTGGVSLPRQSWTAAPTVTAVTFATISSTYYHSNEYHWDPIAQSAYLSVTNSDPSNNGFIPYDDEHSTAAKVSYSRNRGLGGLMIWELTQDYLPAAANGQSQPLLQSLQSTLATPGPVNIQMTNNNAAIIFDSAPLAQYRVLFTTNLAKPIWLTLTNNVPGNSNGLAPVAIETGPALPKQPQAYYRVKTPP